MMKEKEFLETIKTYCGYYKKQKDDTIYSFMVKRKDSESPICYFRMNPYDAMAMLTLMVADGNLNHNYSYTILDERFNHSLGYKPYIELTIDDGYPFVIWRGIARGPLTCRIQQFEKNVKNILLSK